MQLRLVDLLTVPAPTLTNDSDVHAVMPFVAAARLLGMVAEDHDRMGVYLSSTITVAELPVILESANEGYAYVSVNGLRYGVAVDSGSELDRLCAQRGCDTDRLGLLLYTVVCSKHLDARLPGTLGRSGDEAFPEDYDAAARESRRLRLESWAEEITEAEGVIARNRQLLNRLRTSAPQHP